MSTTTPDDVKPAGRRRAEVEQRPWVPSRDELVDAGFVLATGTIAVLGLSPTYTGPGFALVGVVGLVVGLGLVHLARVLRWPVVAPVLLAVVAFFLLGGPLCLRADGAVAPTPRTLGELSEQLLFGWKDLLTTLPPVDGDGPLLVLPWVLGLAAGTLGGLLARVLVGPSWLRAVLPLVAPLGLLAGVILLGVRSPASLWAQGAAVGALCLTWLVLRAHRADGPVTGGSGRLTRLVTGAALLAVAGLAAQPLGTWAAGGDADAQRVVLRTYVEPPFDVGRYPSPLASFRRYVEMPEPDAVNLYDELLFSTEGVPADTRVRIATLDRYDGVVWGASNGASGAFPGAVDDSFRRVGSTIDNPVAARGGRSLDVRVTLGEGYAGVWLPTVGALQSVHFDTGSDEFAETFRYNLDSGTGVVPSGLGPGDRYTFTAVLPAEEVTAESTPSEQLGTTAEATSFLDAPVAKWTEGIADPMERVFAIAEHLRTEGKYSDGVLAKETIYRPGHFVARLDKGFVNAPLMVGNDEQYAAVMALMATKVGVPARVVFGAVVPQGGEVHGRDVQAWVELRVADGSWRVLPTEDFMGTEKPADQQTETEQQLSGMVIPPPAQVPPPSTIDEQTDAEITARKVRRDAHAAAEEDGLPGWVRALLVYAGGPLLALLTIAAAILAAKVLRRRRRRTAGRTSGRIAGAWRELVDHARDLGTPVPIVGVTRGEQSRLIASAAAPGLARTADLRVFGPAEPREGDASTYWEAVDAERHALSATASRGRRLRGALSLRTFWRRR